MFSPEFGRGVNAILGVADTLSAVYAQLAYQKGHETREAELLKYYPLDGIYHNAGSADQFPGRFQEGLEKPITGLEIDVISYCGNLIAGHSIRSFRRSHKENSSAITTQRVERLVSDCVEQNKGIHFDVKLSHKDQKGMQQLTTLVDTIPDKIPVWWSGRDWYALAELHKRTERPHTTLFTVDGHVGNTWESYKRNVADRAPVDSMRNVGVSIRLGASILKYGEY